MIGDRNDKLIQEMVTKALQKAYKAGKENSHYSFGWETAAMMTLIDTAVKMSNKKVDN